MAVTVRPIDWTPMPRVPHGLIGTVQGRYGVRRVAGLISENDNPRRPRGSPGLARPYTLELYLPLTGGQDRVTKYLREEDAKREAMRLLLAFVQDVVEER